MLDIGWQEVLIILVIALVVIGPKDLPKVVRTVGQWTGKARSYARDFQRTIEGYADESEISAIQKELAEANKELKEARQDLQSESKKFDEDMAAVNEDMNTSSPGSAEDNNDTQKNNNSHNSTADPSEIKDSKQGDDK
tara:strand:- start:27533 stop:27946 length:414 start_codon:yes stop_codon:yes gene_type:complete